MRVAAGQRRGPASRAGAPLGRDVHYRESPSRPGGAPATAFLALGIACALSGPAVHASTQHDPAPAATASIDPGPADFFSAKAIADADEASLDAAARSALQAQLHAFLDAGIAQCATEQASRHLEDFVVVMRLDADGRVGKTWRRGSTPLALCVERYARGKIAFVPPRAPFHSSLEVSFVP